MCLRSHLVVSKVMWELHGSYKGIMRELWGDTVDLQGNYTEITGEL